MVLTILETIMKRGFFSIRFWVRLEAQGGDTWTATWQHCLWWKLGWKMLCQISHPEASLTILQTRIELTPHPLIFAVMRQQSLHHRKKLLQTIWWRAEQNAHVLQTAKPHEEEEQRGRQQMEVKINLLSPFSQTQESDTSLFLLSSFLHSSLCEME